MGDPELVVSHVSVPRVHIEGVCVSGDHMSPT
jgi:hypothetical protein